MPPGRPARPRSRRGRAPRSSRQSSSARAPWTASRISSTRTSWMVHVSLDEAERLSGLLDLAVPQLEVEEADSREQVLRRNVERATGTLLWLPRGGCFVASHRRGSREPRRRSAPGGRVDSPHPRTSPCRPPGRTTRRAAASRRRIRAPPRRDSGDPRWLARGHPSWSAATPLVRAGGFRVGPGAVPADKPRRRPQSDRGVRAAAP